MTSAEPLIDPFPGPDPFPPDFAFDQLDAALPLALLPLRLEVRFRLERDPPELCVRIFPDHVHADGHRAGLTKNEERLGHAFWRRCWRAGRDPLLLTVPDGSPPATTGTAGRDAAFAWLAGGLGPWRAAWVAKQTEPSNSAVAPPQPLPEGAPLLPPPDFPEVDSRAAGGPVWARLLPARFALVLWDAEAIVGTWWGKPLTGDLAMAPGLVEAGDDLDGRGLLDAQGLGWTHDFEAAVEAGMAIRVGTLEERRLRSGFTRLIVIGVRAGDEQEGLEGLLAGHRYTHGLDFVPQGTPTNATETAAPGLSLERPDLGALRVAELAAADSAAPQARTPDHPGEPGQGPVPSGSQVVDGEGDLYRMTAADAGVLVLGLGVDTALARAANADLAESRHAEALSRALWPATLGHYLDELMQVGLAAADRDWLRDWSTRYVRGAGLLPTLLLGAQPYGLLPVSRIDSPQQPAGRVEQIERVLALLRPFWDDVLPGLPRLDPEAGDAAPGEGERAALVSQILGGVPHPVAPSLQLVDDDRADYRLQWDFRLNWLMLSAAIAPGADGEPGVVVNLPDSWESNVHQVNSVLWGEWLVLRDALIAATTPGEQIAALTLFADVQAFFRDDEVYAGVRDFYAEWLDYTRDNLIAFVEAHEARTTPVSWLVGLVPGITRLMGDADDPSAFFASHPSRADWALPLVAAGRTEADVTALRDWLEDIAATVARGAAPTHDFGAAHPLLRQLVAWSATRAAGTGDALLLGQGLDTLSALTRTQADPVGELERLLREAVSPHTNRLDAWYTGIAAARLEAKRAATERGIQVGAYGWLEDVRPRERRASQGYVLAPSAAHATTAAILRSGWSAFGGDAESAGLAVDLSSDRIRRARWLIGGVRRGQDLGALLGARFERGLHDARLDVRIEALRIEALTAAGSAAPPTAIVDGLLLARARAYQEAPADERDGFTGAEEAAAAALDALLADPSIPARDRTSLAAVLDGLLGDLDAVADASVAQSVFSLTEGNVPEAGVALTAAATGELAFPRLRFADSRRPARTITHRLLALVDPERTGAWPGVRRSGRALAAPGVEAWLEDLLGHPARYALGIRFEDPVTGAQAAPPLTRTLADAGLSALDVVALAPAGEQTGPGRLGAVLGAWAEGLRPATLDPAAVVSLVTSDGDPSLDDLATATRGLRALLADARDLDGRDVAPPGATDAASGLDTAELEARVDRVRAALETGRRGLIDAVAAKGDVRAAILALAGFDLAGGVPRGTDRQVLTAQATALVATVSDRLAQLRAREDEEAGEWPALDELGRYRALRDRLILLVGHKLPIAPRFTAAEGPPLDATFARARLGSPAAATGWLAAAGRVDPGARRLRVAIDLVEALGGGAAVGFALGQLPDHPDEGWAAVTRPAHDERGRLCLLATGSRPRFARGAAAGLVLGAWTEVIPLAKRTAALGVHFDSPAARAPQAILLCTAEAETGFSFDLVCDLLVQTLELAQVRLVGPQTLGALGQHLPATYLQGGIRAEEPA